MNKEIKPKTTRSREHKLQLAKDLYLHTDYTREEICVLVGWTPKTFTTNKQKYHWDEEKHAQTVTASNIITVLYQKAYEEVNKEKVSADALIKIVNAIEKLSGTKATISQTINVFKEFASWAFSQDAELTKEINRLQKKFINEKLSE